MPRRGPEVHLSARRRGILERYAGARSLPVRLVDRARMILYSADGLTSVEQARLLGGEAQRSRRWRRRWAAEASRVQSAEASGATDRELAALIVQLLSDEPRSGRPPTFGPEQVAQIVAIACEAPEDSDRPVTHWTAPEVAEEAAKRGIVESISARHVNRLLKRG